MEPAHNLIVISRWPPYIDRCLTACLAIPDQGESEADRCAESVGSGILVAVSVD